MARTDSWQAVSGSRAIARRVYTLGVRLLLASIVIQFFLAGLGVFDSSSFFWWHVNVNGAVVGLLPLVLVGVGWFGRVPRNTLWLTAAVFGLVVIPYRTGAPGWLRAVSGLHVVNALFIFWVGLRLLEKTSGLGAQLTE